MPIYTDPLQIKIRSALILKRNIDVSELCFFCQDLSERMIVRKETKIPLISKLDIEQMDELITIICNDHFELEYPQTWQKAPKEKKEELTQEIIRKVSEIVLSTKTEEIFETVQLSSIMIINELFEQIIKPQDYVPKQ